MRARHDQIAVRQAYGAGQQARFRRSPRDVLAIALDPFGGEKRDPVRGELGRLLRQRGDRSEAARHRHLWPGRARAGLFETQGRRPDARRRGIVRAVEHHGPICRSGWNAQAVSDDHQWASRGKRLKGRFRNHSAGAAGTRREGLANHSGAWHHPAVTGGDPYRIVALLAEISRTEQMTPTLAGLRARLNQT